MLLTGEGDGVGVTVVLRVVEVIVVNGVADGVVVVVFVLEGVVVLGGFVDMGVVVDEEVVVEVFVDDGVVPSVLEMVANDVARTFPTVSTAWAGATTVSLTLVHMECKHAW